MDTINKKYLVEVHGVTLVHVEDLQTALSVAKQQFSKYKKEVFISKKTGTRSQVLSSVTKQGVVDYAI